MSKKSESGISAQPAHKFFQPLVTEVRTMLTTEAAAFHLNRAPQTLRVWACYENGPLRPVRINGRLAWLVADIKALLNKEGA